MKESHDYHDDGPPLRARDVIRRLLLAEFDMGLDQIMEALKSQGLPLSRVAVASIRHSFRDDCRFLSAAGLLKLPSPSSSGVANVRQRLSLTTDVR
jgi:hypothetical protein